MFALVNENELLLGPIQFNYRLINSVLEEELDLDYRIGPSDYSKVPLSITDNVKLLYAVEDKPSFNQKYEEIFLYKYEISEDKVIFCYEKQEKNLDLIKQEHKNIISSERWHRENSRYLDICINDTNIKVPINRETRISLITKLTSGNEPYNFKFGDVWMEVTHEDLKTIISKIDEKVQEHFDWEFSKIKEIDLCTSTSEIEAIDFFDPMNKINDLLSAG